MISSQLSSQLFSKNMTWTLMQRKYRVFIDVKTPSALSVTVYSCCVYVHLPKSKHFRGISIYVSFNDYLSLLIERNLSKSKPDEVVERAKNVYTVASTQPPGIQTIFISRTKLKCSCMLFGCLSKRIKTESPYLMSLIERSPYFSGQTVCHHIEAVLSACGFSGLYQFYEHIPLTTPRDSFGSHNNRDYYLEP